MPIIGRTLKTWLSPFDGVNSLITTELALPGLPTETPIALTGNPEAGKSIMALEIAYKIVSQLGGNIMVVNTEKPGTQLYAFWGGVFAAKYGVPDTNLYVEEALTVEKLLALNGYTIKVTQTKGGFDKKTGKPVKPKKIVVQEAVDLEGCLLTKRMRENDARVVIYDSLTTPFNSVIAGGQQNTPERFNVTEMFFESLRLAFFNTGCVPITSNHVSYNPMQPFVSREQFEAKGGKSVTHNSDYIFYIEKQTKGKYALNQRTLWVQRHPSLKDWRQIALLWLDDNGFRELSKADVDALKKEAKAAIIGKDTAVEEGET